MSPDAYEMPGRGSRHVRRFTKVIIAHAIAERWRSSSHYKHMRAHDRDSLNIVDHLEQAFEQAQRNGSRALPQIRAAIDQVIEEIEDPALRGIMRDEPMS